MLGKRILVCDDDPLILRLLQVNLEIEDYEVILAHDGREACEVAEAELPDLIILDIMMPRMDGYEACKRLKETPSVKDIPVVFLSAKAQEEDIEEGTALGAAAYLTKPFEPDELVRVIDGLVSER
jgi:CheY-like chemotaxis protein